LAEFEEEPEKQSVLMSIRITPAMKRRLEDIAAFELTTKESELVREWIRDKIKAYESNPQFKRWKKVQHEREGKLMLETKRKQKEGDTGRRY